MAWVGARLRGTVLESRSGFLRRLVIKSERVQDVIALDSVPDSYEAYLRARGILWMLAVDLFLGCAVGIACCIFSRPLTATINEALQDSTVFHLEQEIVWLMGWPAGFKLNSNLSRFLGEMFLWLISLWSGKESGGGCQCG